MNGKLTISKNNKGIVNVELTDEVSGIRVVSVEMPIVNFAEALFGLAYQDCSFELSPNCEYIGHNRISKPLVAEIKTIGNKKEAIIALKEAIKEYPEWQSNFNLSSHNSFYNSDGKAFARTSMYKYVPVDSEDAT